MNFLQRPALYTDYYELTMAQGYFLSGKHDQKASFDYFFRKNPFEGGFTIFAGLSEFLPLLESLRFHEDELEYLREQGFDERFIDYLDGFEFEGTIYAPREGEIVFPDEPVMMVEGTLLETQLIETLLLNLINFQSLIATKAARMRLVAGEGKKIADFGLRRAQGYGGILASKAAIIGGADSTSNTYAGKAYGLPVTGTMAHSWIQSFGDEIEAFRAFAKRYPDNTILLVDTYNTLKSGVPNAIKVAREMEKEGHKLRGIRLDSGDLAYLSKKARKQLDDAGLEYVKIAASNQLDEYLIRSLLQQEAPIDLFGVGTRLVTGNESPALDGVYKLSSINGEPKMKYSENIEKTNLPGQKKVHRFLNGKDEFYRDGIFLRGEEEPESIQDPFYPARSTDIGKLESTPLLTRVMYEGELTGELPTVAGAAEYARRQLRKLPVEHKRFENPHIYKVGISPNLYKLKQDLYTSF